MNKNQQMFVVLGSLVVMLATTLPLQPQVLRKRNSPVAADPPPATTKKPTDQVVADPPATTRKRTDQMIDVPEAPNVESRTFKQPRYLDDRLDWCVKWGFECGKPAALAFCHRRRFEDATAFEAEVVGRSAQTRLLGSEQVCNADFCTAFSYITCSGPIGTDRVFANPTYKGYRLDVCWLGKGYAANGRRITFAEPRGFLNHWTEPQIESPVDCRRAR